MVGTFPVSINNVILKTLHADNSDHAKMWDCDIYKIRIMELKLYTDGSIGFSVLVIINFL